MGLEKKGEEIATIKSINQHKQGYRNKNPATSTQTSSDLYLQVMGLKSNCSLLLLPRDHTYSTTAPSLLCLPIPYFHIKCLLNISKFVVSSTSNLLSPLLCRPFSRCKLRVELLETSRAHGPIPRTHSKPLSTIPCQ